MASLPEDLRLLVIGHAKGVPDAWITTRNENAHWPDGSTSKAGAITFPPALSTFLASASESVVPM